MSATVQIKNNKMQLKYIHNRNVDIYAVSREGKHNHIINMRGWIHTCTGCPKSNAPSLTCYILRYENSIVIKEVCSDRVTFHNFCDTKHDHIDDILNELP